MEMRGAASGNDPFTFSSAAVGGGGREIRCRHLWHSQQSRLLETSAHHSSCYREAGSTDDHAKLRLFVDESMIPTSLDCSRTTHKVHYTSWARSCPTVSGYRRHFQGHDAPGRFATLLPGYGSNQCWMPSSHGFSSGTSEPRSSQDAGGSNVFICAKPPIEVVTTPLGQLARDTFS